MPLAAVERPSIGLSLLAAALRGAGIETDVMYANLAFTERAGLDLVTLLGRLRDDRMVGEWLFSRAAFPEFFADDECYFALIDLSLAEALAGSRERLLDMLEQARALATAFVDEVARRIVDERPRIVGVTSMFQQRCASIALLRRIHELDPRIITMMGGANCEGAMGRAHFEAFPYIDYVVCGEADGLIVNVVSDALRWGRDVEVSRLPLGVYGPAHRRSSEQIATSGATPHRPLVHALDALPIPEYHDYFEAIEASPMRHRIRPGLLAETSRGCWWGEKHHCTFCGLNGTGMTYRVKSAPRVLEELKTLTDRYGLRNLELVDNILAMPYFDTLLPSLADVAPPYVLFAETKSNLRRHHLERLAAAGIRWIQPGVENLHDEVLRLMDKGCTGLINVQLMKWAREFGVHLTWFYLYGFPGEREAWYTEVAGWLPLVTHLQPPGGMTPVRFDRFSPYHTRSAQYGLDLRPNRAHAFIFPLEPELLNDFAYFFESAEQMREDAPGDWPPGKKGPGYGLMQQAITQWHERFWHSLPDVLHVTDDGARLSIIDTRAVATARRHSLEGLAREVYLACDQPQTLRTCAATVGASEQDVAAIWSDLDARRLILRQGDRVLSLAVRGELPTLPRRDQFPGGTVHSSAAPGGSAAQESARPREREKVSH